MRSDPAKDWQQLQGVHVRQFTLVKCIDCNKHTQSRRKSVSGNWKTNVGPSVLEQIGISERYKKWLQDVSDEFEGLELCSIEAVIDKEGKEFIIKVHGSSMPLLGESQDDDRRAIVDLIHQRMNAIAKSSMM